MSATTAIDTQITFPDGFVGQPDWKQFVLVSPEEDGPIQLLQSTEHAELALMVTNPLQLVPDYSVQLSEDDADLLGLAPNEQPTLLCTISIHGSDITTNLAGPLVINARTRQAKQIVLVDPAYSTRHPLATLEGQES